MNKPIITYQDSPAERNGRLPVDYPLHYPRVSEILRATNRDKGKEKKLAEWRDKINRAYYSPRNKQNKDAEEEIKEAREIGIAMHLCIEDFLTKNTSPILKDYHPEISLLWQKVFSLLSVLTYAKKLRTEYPIYSDSYKYRGTADLVLTWVGSNELTVLDWTRKGRPVKKEWVHDKFVQTTAYAIALEEMHKEPINKIVVVVVSKQKLQIFHDDPDNYKVEWLERIDEYRERLKKLNELTPPENRVRH